MRRSIYVETVIRADPERLWRVTQDPAEHARWDLRFSSITYATGSTGGFDYATQVLPGVRIAGTGVTTSAGRRTSALVFGSEHPLSLIRSGSGYWRYVPSPEGIRFLTGYDYAVRWGAAGRVADRLFRPVIGWATAWSFDRLRIWLETGVPPEGAVRRALASWLVRPGVSPSTVPSAGRCLRAPARQEHP